MPAPPSGKARNAEALSPGPSLWYQGACLNVGLAEPASRGVKATVEVQVRDNNVDQALRALKKKMQREGLYREMRMRRHFEKPSERRARERAEAIRRYRKLMRKRAERDEL
jgi:small subunit ribosomal protein S21